METQSATNLYSDFQTQPVHPLLRSETMDPKLKFYNHFNDTVAVLEDQIAQLRSAAAVIGERQEAIDHILAGITKLQNEVADASEYTPSYDRRQYAQTVKRLQDKLNQTVAQVKPRSRFQFKRSAARTQHVDMGAPANDPRLNPGRFSPGSAQEISSIATTTETDPSAEESTPSQQTKDYNAELSSPAANSSHIRRPSFSQATSITLNAHSNLHILCPPSAQHATSSASLTNLKSCVIDLSAAATTTTPFQGLALKDIENSVIVLGRVSGPVHITGLKNSVLVMTARQVRIHECRNVDIYLMCASHPIIEDCSGMRFAPLPEVYMTDADKESENRWDQVDDFKWLKAGPSPHWTVLSEAERLTESTWTDVVRDESGVSVLETLRKVGISRSRSNS